MPTFQELPRAVLVAISRASGDSYRDIEGAELVAELERAGHEANSQALYNLMFRLRDDGYVEFTATMGGGGIESLDLIRLGALGRQEVQGWPRATGVSEADVEALIRAFEAYADDPNAPANERQRASEAATAARDLGVEVAGGVIASWLRSIGLG